MNTEKAEVDSDIKLESMDESNTDIGQNEREDQQEEFDWGDEEEEKKNPGTVHAIKGGTLILETQQNSDITYRVYDYDRLSDGKPRPLHVEKSIDVIKAPFDESEVKGNRECIDEQLEKLVNCEYYTVWKLAVDEPVELCLDGGFFLASVVDGDGRINGEKLNKGDHFILPHNYGVMRFEGHMELIISCP